MLFQMNGEGGSSEGQIQNLKKEMFVFERKSLFTKTKMVYKSVQK